MPSLFQHGLVALEKSLTNVGLIQTNKLDQKRPVRIITEIQLSIHILCKSNSVTDKTKWVDKLNELGEACLCPIWSRSGIDSFDVDGVIQCFEILPHVITALNVLNEEENDTFSNPLLDLLFSINWVNKEYIPAISRTVVEVFDCLNEDQLSSFKANLLEVSGVDFSVKGLVDLFGVAASCFEMSEVGVDWMAIIIHLYRQMRTHQINSSGNSTLEMELLLRKEMDRLDIDYDNFILTFEQFVLGALQKTTEANHTAAANHQIDLCALDENSSDNSSVAVEVPELSLLLLVVDLFNSAVMTADWHTDSDSNKAVSRMLPALISSLHSSHCVEERSEYSNNNTSDSQNSRVVYVTILACAVSILSSEQSNDGDNVVVTISTDISQAVSAVVHNLLSEQSISSHDFSVLLHSMLVVAAYPAIVPQSCNDLIAVRAATTASTGSTAAIVDVNEIISLVVSSLFVADNEAHSTIILSTILEGMVSCSDILTHKIRHQNSSNKNNSGDNNSGSGKVVLSIDQLESVTLLQEFLMSLFSDLCSYHSALISQQSDAIQRYFTMLMSLHSDGIKHILSSFVRMCDVACVKNICDELKTVLVSETRHDQKIIAIQLLVQMLCNPNIFITDVNIILIPLLQYVVAELPAVFKRELHTEVLTILSVDSGNSSSSSSDGGAGVALSIRREVLLCLRDIVLSDSLQHYFTTTDIYSESYFMAGKTGTNSGDNKNSGSSGSKLYFDPKSLITGMEQSGAISSDEKRNNTAVDYLFTDDVFTLLQCVFRLDLLLYPGIVSMGMTDICKVLLQLPDNAQEGDCCHGLFGESTSDTAASTDVATDTDSESKSSLTNITTNIQETPPTSTQPTIISYLCAVVSFIQHGLPTVEMECIPSTLLHKLHNSHDNSNNNNNITNNSSNNRSQFSPQSCAKQDLLDKINNNNLNVAQITVVYAAVNALLRCLLGMSKINKQQGNNPCFSLAVPVLSSILQTLLIICPGVQETSSAVRINNSTHRQICDFYTANLTGLDCFEGSDNETATLQHIFAPRHTLSCEQIRELMNLNVKLICNGGTSIISDNTESESMSLSDLSPDNSLYSKHIAQYLPDSMKWYALLYALNEILLVSSDNSGVDSNSSKCDCLESILKQLFTTYDQLCCSVAEPQWVDRYMAVADSISSTLEEKITAAKTLTRHQLSSSPVKAPTNNISSSLFSGLAKFIPPSVASNSLSNNSGRHNVNNNTNRYGSKLLMSDVYLEYSDTIVQRETNIISLDYKTNTKIEYQSSLLLPVLHSFIALMPSELCAEIQCFDTPLSLCPDDEVERSSSIKAILYEVKCNVCKSIAHLIRLTRGGDCIHNSKHSISQQSGIYSYWLEKTEYFVSELQTAFQKGLSDSTFKGYEEVLRTLWAQFNAPSVHDLGTHTLSEYLSLISDGTIITAEDDKQLKACGVSLLGIFKSYKYGTKTSIIDSLLRLALDFSGLHESTRRCCALITSIAREEYSRDEEEEEQECDAMNVDSSSRVQGSKEVVLSVSHEVSETVFAKCIEFVDKVSKQLSKYSENNTHNHNININSNSNSSSNQSSSLKYQHAVSNMTTTIFSTLLRLFDESEQHYDKIRDNITGNKTKVYKRFIDLQPNARVTEVLTILNRMCKQGVDDCKRLIAAGEDIHRLALLCNQSEQNSSVGNSGNGCGDVLDIKIERHTETTAAPASEVSCVFVSSLLHFLCDDGDDENDSDSYNSNNPPNTNNNMSVVLNLVSWLNGTAQRTNLAAKHEQLSSRLSELYSYLVRLQQVNTALSEIKYTVNEQSRHYPQFVAQGFKAKLFAKLENIANYAEEFVDVLSEVFGEAVNSSPTKLKGVKRTSPRPSPSPNKKIKSTRRTPVKSSPVKHISPTKKTSKVSYITANLNKRHDKNDNFSDLEDFFCDDDEEEELLEAYDVHGRHALGYGQEYAEGDASQSEYEEDDEEE